MVIGLSEVVYSWSKLNSFYMAKKGEGCYYDYWLTYFKHERSGANYFTEYGTLFHETMEGLLKGEIDRKDLEQLLTTKLKQFKTRAPFPNMKKSYEKSLFNFFDQKYVELISNIEPLEMEQLKEFAVGGVKLKGYPDLIANHKKHGFVVADYKTSRVYEGEKLRHNVLQLVLYGIKIAEEYNRKPDGYLYIFPREKENIELFIPYSDELIKEAEDFVVDTVKEIESHTEWTPRCCNVDSKKDFYANNLCCRKCMYWKGDYNPFADFDYNDPFVS